MSTYNDASLIYYPSGYKASKAYSLKPTDGSGDLTFTRASTATRVNAEGLIESVAANVPRLDNSQNGCSTLLLEPQRTNLVFPSNVSSGWSSLGGATVTANATTSPEGLANATAMYETNITSNFVKYRDSTVAIGSVSIYAIIKTNGRNIQLGDLGGGGGESAKFDLVNGTIIAQNTSNNAYIQSYGDGWYKVGFSMTKSVTLLRIGIYTLDYETSNTTHAGDSTKGIFIYHVQGEQGSYSTSVIPTTSTAVTRVADGASKSGISSLIGQTEGTIFIDIDLNSRDGNTYFVIAPNILATQIYIGIGIQPTRITFEVLNSGLQAKINFSSTTTGRFKIAAAYKENDFAFYVNGVQIGTDNSGTVPACSQLGFLAYIQTQTMIYNSAILFPTRKANAELAELTTL